MSAALLTAAGTTPLVLDSPHSGTVYPADFDHACDPLVLRRAEDTHVEKIYDFAPALGAAWIEAHFPRIYLDANRDTLELDEDPRQLLGAEERIRALTVDRVREAARAWVNPGRFVRVSP